MATIASNFTLPDQQGDLISLSDFRGSYVLLIFYPTDHGFICTKQLCEYRDNWQEFTSRNLIVLGISGDSVASHQEFARMYGFPFPLLADVDKSVCKSYKIGGLLGISNRAYVLVDSEGIVAYRYSEPTPLTRKSTSAILKIVDRYIAHPQ